MGAAQLRFTVSPASATFLFRRNKASLPLREFVSDLCQRIADLDVLADLGRRKNGKLRGKRRSLKPADRNAYVAAYSRPGRMRAGWAYFAAWPETAKDFAQMAKTNLTMPVLSIAGEKASAAILGPQMKLVATTVSAVHLKNTGHWLMEERPEETTGGVDCIPVRRRPHHGLLIDFSVTGLRSSHRSLP